MPITRAYKTSGILGGATTNGETLVADSSATTGLRWQPYTYQNAVYNSSMNIWQRGTSVAIGSGNSYTADRWSLYRGTTGATVSRQATGDTTNLPNIQYCARVQRDSGNTNTSVMYFRQTFETLDSIKFAGKQVALSFYARKGSNFSAASDLLRVLIATGTGTDQSPISFTGEAVYGDTNITLTSTWQRFTISATLPTNTNEIFLNFSYTPVGTAGANDFFEITGVQFEFGQVASPYKPMSVTLAGELAACQRYYYSIAGLNVNLANATGYSTTVIRAVRPHPVPMRGTPSFSASSGTSYYRYFGNNTSIGVSSITDDYKDSLSIQYNITTTGLTVGYSYWIVLDNASSKIEISAEL